MKRTLLTILSVIVLSVSSAKAQYDPYAFAMWQMQQNNMMCQQNAQMIQRYNQVVNQPVYFPQTPDAPPLNFNQPVFVPVTTMVSQPVQTTTNEYNSHTTTNSSRSSTRPICRTCHGSGKCNACGGSGIRTDNLFGTGSDPTKKCGV